jgi:hypothetical protein
MKLRHDSVVDVDMDEDKYMFMGLHLDVVEGDVIEMDWVEEESLLGQIG